eukprot:gene17209-22730_t
MSTMFDVAIWTSSKDNAYHNSLPYRDYKPHFIKLLEKVWNAYPEYSPNNTVMLDDSVEKCIFNNKYNNIHPKPYQPDFITYNIDEDNDTELQSYCNPNEPKGSPNEYVAYFLTIYIAEAHARDEWWMPTTENAQDAAKSFQKDFNYPCEVISDSMKNEVYENYDSWPERLYIIEKGIIVYQGGMGPFDYKLAEVKDWLINRFGLRGEAISLR